MNFKRFFNIICLCFIVVVSSAQDYRFGTMSTVNLNKNIGKEWAINLKWQSRQLVQQGDFGASKDVGFDYLLSDFSVLASKRTGFNNRITGGYQLRSRDEQYVHYFIFQYVMLRAYSNFRMAYRFAADQAFVEQELDKFRFRYRMTMELPLNGEAVDVKELYLKINNEYLNSFDGGELDLEIRLAPMLGYVFDDMNKFEFGLDYRLDSIIEGARNNFWLSVGWYLKL